MFFKRFPASITLNFYHITLSLLFNLASTDFARFNYFVIAYKEGKEFTPANADSYDPNVCKDFLTDPVKAAVAPMAVIEIPLAVLLNLSKSLSIHCVYLLDFLALSPTLLIPLDASIELVPTLLNSLDSPYKAVPEASLVSLLVLLFKSFRLSEAYITFAPIRPKLLFNLPTLDTTALLPKPEEFKAPCVLANAPFT